MSRKAVGNKAALPDQADAASFSLIIDIGVMEATVSFIAAGCF